MTAELARKNNTHTTLTWFASTVEVYKCTRTHTSERMHAMGGKAPRDYTCSKSNSQRLLAFALITRACGHF